MARYAHTADAKGKTKGDRMRAIAHVLIGTCLVAVTAMATETGSLTGHFEGTGRACYGTLAIKAKTISWQTTFSQCKAAPFELIEQDRKNGKIRLAYRLKARTPGCRYSILTLTHAGPASETGWEATGYGSRQSYEADKSSSYKANAADMMSCPLIRAQDN
jgi:hypothetical protein